MTKIFFKRKRIKRKNLKELKKTEKENYRLIYFININSKICNKILTIKSRNIYYDQVWFIQVMEGQLTFGNKSI